MSPVGGRPHASPGLGWPGPGLNEAGAFKEKRAPTLRTTRSAASSSGASTHTHTHTHARVQREFLARGAVAMAARAGFAASGRPDKAATFRIEQRKRRLLRHATSLAGRRLAPLPSLGAPGPLSEPVWLSGNTDQRGLPQRPSSLGGLFPGADEAVRCPYRTGRPARGFGAGCACWPTARCHAAVTVCPAERALREGSC